MKKPDEDKLFNWAMGILIFGVLTPIAALITAGSIRLILKLLELI